ncbi:MAG: hypothetical protein OXE45_07670 [bacterium]|nr:hypothetical protein [bacterium]
MIYTYPCDLTRDDEWLVATFAVVTEAISGGPDRAEALVQAIEALAFALSGYIHNGWDIPEPSVQAAGQEMVAVPTVVAAKLALYSAMRAQQVTKVELARRLGVSEAAVRRLVNPDHRSHIGQVNKALAAVGHSLVVEVVPA